MFKVFNKINAFNIVYFGYSTAHHGLMLILSVNLRVIFLYETVLRCDWRNSTAARFIISRGSSVTKFRATFNITRVLTILRISFITDDLPRLDLKSLRLLAGEILESYRVHYTKVLEISKMIN